MTASDEQPSGDRGPPGNTKVARNIRTYGLEDLGEELSRRWVGDGTDRRSLRDLAGYVNRELLRAAMADAGEQPVEGEVGNLYRLLTGSEVSAGARARAETKLERAGVDVDSLRNDFVSHQAVHTYLTDVRDVSPPTSSPSASEQVERRRDTIQRLRNRLVAVVEESIATLRDAGHLSLGSFEVIASVTVYCTDCGRTQEVGALLDERGCDCQPPAD